MYSWSSAKASVRLGGSLVIGRPLCHERDPLSCRCMSAWLSRWNPWRGLGALPRKIWIHFAATLVNRMGTMAIPFLVLYLTKDVGFTAEHAGLALSLYGFGSLCVSPFLGKLADSVGHVRMMKVSLVSSGLVLLAYPLARSPGQR